MKNEEFSIYNILFKNLINVMLSVNKGTKFKMVWILMKIKTSTKREKANAEKEEEEEEVKEKAKRKIILL